MEDPWADSATTSDPLSQPSTTSSSTTTAPSGAGPTLPAPAVLSPTTASSSSSTTTRPSRLTPRRLVAQPTRLQAVEDDPLGPLGAAPAPGADDAAAKEGPPVPPLKETAALPLRTTMPGGSAGGGGGGGTAGVAGGAGRYKAAPDPHRITDDEDEGDGEGVEGRRGGRQPPPVQAALPSPVRSSVLPGVSVEAAARPRFWIAVGDPIKVGDLTSSHIVYSVRTKVCCSLGEGRTKGLVGFGGGLLTVTGMVATDNLQSLPPNRV